MHCIFLLLQRTYLCVHLNGDHMPFCWYFYSCMFCTKMYAIKNIIELHIGNLHQYNQVEIFVINFFNGTVVFVSIWKKYINFLPAHVLFVQDDHTTLLMFLFLQALYSPDTVVDKTHLEPFMMTYDDTFDFGPFLSMSIYQKHFNSYFDNFSLVYHVQGCDVQGSNHWCNSNYSSFLLSSWAEG